MKLLTLLLAEDDHLTKVAACGALAQLTEESVLASEKVAAVKHWEELVGGACLSGKTDLQLRWVSDSCP